MQLETVADDPSKPPPTTFAGKGGLTHLVVSRHLCREINHVILISHLLSHYELQRPGPGPKLGWGGGGCKNTMRRRTGYFSTEEGSGKLGKWKVERAGEETSK